MELPGGMNRPIVVGVLGSGNVLGAYLQQLDRLVPRGAAAYGPVVARSEQRRHELATVRPALPLVASVAELLESPVDVVVVITPPPLHAEHVRAALLAGKHVLAEKPVALDTGEAEELYRLAEELGLHLVAAPFVTLSPVVAAMWALVHDGEIGQVHTARAMYGNSGASWSAWFHDGAVGPMAELGVYNLTTLTAVLGPVAEVVAAESVAVPVRTGAGFHLDDPGTDVSLALCRHVTGAISSITAGQAVQAYRRPAVELYGVAGTVNLLGDDWDPEGLEVFRADRHVWERHESPDRTWLWTDGLRDLVTALRLGRPPRHQPQQALHVLDVVDAVRRSAASRAWATVPERTWAADLRGDGAVSYVHDHTRAPEDQ